MLLSWIANKLKFFAIHDSTFCNFCYPFAIFAILDSKTFLILLLSFCNFCYPFAIFAILLQFLLSFCNFCYPFAIFAILLHFLLSFCNFCYPFAIFAILLQFLLSFAILLQFLLLELPSTSYYLFLTLTYLETYPSIEIIGLKSSILLDHLPGQ
jgi:hypothetical protein